MIEIEIFYCNKRGGPLHMLLQSPFTNQASMVEKFTNFNVWLGIRKLIEKINDNIVVV